MSERNHLHLKFKAVLYFETLNLFFKIQHLKRFKCSQCWNFPTDLKTCLKCRIWNVSQVANHMQACWRFLDRWVALSCFPGPPLWPQSKINRISDKKTTRKAEIITWGYWLDETPNCRGCEIQRGEKVISFPGPTGWLLFKIQIDWRRNKSLKCLIL